MVKQGHYASSSRRKVVHQLKQHHQAQADRVIATAAIAEFLQVRYHLTQAGAQRPIVRKTMQRWLTQWLALATATPATTWSVATLTAQTLQAFNRQLPWQGYALVLQNFAAWQAFLVKEVPAVPLTTRLTLTALQSPTQIQAQVMQQLAVNGLLGLLGQDEQRLAQVTTTQVAQLQTSLQVAGKVDWQRVATLLEPVAATATSQDISTQTWVQQLRKLTPKDFD
ncbi:hypothetical protein C5Z26_08545 [Lactobacillus sp. CBA3606]|uniref:hypothetical protein n=1 Tax=Lactobacillus sp. CBA3606 TaxID=2099789 RepID=UPI000CFD1FC4|nr:hypothetical protein [Lactobacillus sp. CBA3606]AVK64158.1 hypothetical protein C5Z26_08545 [Lactobacillus sp. CBA3606]